MNLKIITQDLEEIIQTLKKENSDIRTSITYETQRLVDYYPSLGFQESSVGIVSVSITWVLIELKNNLKRIGQGCEYTILQSLKK